MDDDLTYDITQQYLCMFNYSQVKTDCSFG